MNEPWRTQLAKRMMVPLWYTIIIEVIKLHHINIIGVRKKAVMLTREWLWWDQEGSAWCSKPRPESLELVSQDVVSMGKGCIAAVVRECTRFVLPLIRTDLPLVASLISFMPPTLAARQHNPKKLATLAFLLFTFDP